MAKKKRFITFRSIRYLLIIFLAKIPYFKKKFNINIQLVDISKIQPNFIRNYKLDYELDFNDSEKEFFGPNDKISFNKKLALINNVTVNGRTGTTNDINGDVISDYVVSSCMVHRNQICLYPLKDKVSDDSTLYVNCLYIKKGHKQIYHFYQDIVSVITVIYNSLDEIANASPIRKISILVREDLSDLQKQFYSMLPKQIKGFEIDIQTVSCKEKLLCKNLLWTFILTNLPRIYLDMETIDFSNSVMSNVLEKPVSFSDHIFLSRKDARLRNLINEKELLDQFKNYTPFIASKHCSLEQIRIFHNSKNIIGIHGAGLINLIYAKEKTNIIEILPADHNDIAYIVISKLKNLNYKFVVGSKGDYSQNFEVDIKDVKTLISN